jgi:hypothetical protein
MSPNTTQGMTLILDRQMLLECLGTKDTVVSSDVLDTNTMLLGKRLKLNLSFKG